MYDYDQELNLTMEAAKAAGDLLQEGFYGGSRHNLDKAVFQAHEWRRRRVQRAEDGLEG